MTPEAVVYDYLRKASGIDTYAFTAVPSDAAYPYLTYELTSGGWTDGEVSVAVSIWTYGDSEAFPNSLARRLYDAIGYGGTFVLCDGGAIWFKRGNPWSQSVGGESDKVKRRYINVDLEYLVQ